PVQEDDIRNTLGVFAMAAMPKQVNVYTLVPETSIENSQVGLRIAGRLLDQDVSLSYYHDRWGIPTPAWATKKPNGVVDVGVMWPRMGVLGLDIAGSSNKLGGLGYWVEAGVFFPQEVRYGTYDDDTGPGGTSITGHDRITFMKDANG